MKPDRRIPALDTLRAFAILAVMASHFIHTIPAQPKFIENLFHFGSTGVDLFFVLSGFLIGGIILRELDTAHNLTLPRFLWRRWMRTLPAYFAVLAFLAIGSQFRERTLEGGYSWAYIFFLQNYTTPMARFGWSWSLCTEEHFYVTLPVLVVAGRWLLARVPVRVLLRGIAVTAFLGSNLTRLFIWQTNPEFNPWRDIASVTHLRLDGLAVGIFLATLERPRNVRVMWLLATVGLGGLLVMSTVYGERIYNLNGYAAVSVCYGLLVHVSAGGNTWSQLRIPGLRVTSDLSYSLYLTHLIVMLGLQTVFPKAHGWGFGLLIYFSCFPAAAALRYGVEVPFLWLRDRYEGALFPERKIAPAAVADPSR